MHLSPPGRGRTLLWDGGILAVGSWLVVPPRVLWNKAWKSQFCLVSSFLQSLSGETQSQSPASELNSRLLGMGESVIKNKKKNPMETQRWKYEQGIKLPSLERLCPGPGLNLRSLQCCALFSWVDHFQVAVSMGFSWWLSLLRLWILYQSLGLDSPPLGGASVSLGLC